MALSVEETEELIDDLNEYANSSVKVLEQAVVLVSRTKDGENVIQFPLTRLRQIEDIKDLPQEDGGLEWDDNMKLYVKASDLLQDGGGLTTDDNGDIYVDFSLMPTDKFEDLLKTLTIPIYLDANLYQYVDCNNGDDTIEDGRGSEDMPWKTISACVDYCTTYYNVNSHHIEIRVLAGTYDEAVSLGTYTVTTGYIRIRSYPNAHEAIITQTNATTVNVVGGPWRLTGLRIEFHANDEWTTDDSTSGSAVYADGTNAQVMISGCQFYAAYESDTTGGSWAIRILQAASGGSLLLQSDENYTQSIEYHKGVADLYVLYAQRSATISLYYSYNDLENRTFECFGEATTFVQMTRGSSLTHAGGGYQLVFSVPDGETATGKRYYAYSGSSINPSDSTDDNSYFPGDTAGGVEESTYCWYQ